MKDGLKRREKVRNARRRLKLVYATLTKGRHGGVGLRRTAHGRAGLVGGTIGDHILPAGVGCGLGLRAGGAAVGS